MKNQFTPHILLFFIVTILVIAGCIAFGVKKPTANKANNTNQPDLLTVAAPNLTTCPKVLQRSKNGKTDPFYFSYLLDTSDENCIARTLDDIINNSGLINKGIYDSLAGSTNLKKGKNSFSHYYKGIKVESSGISLYVVNDKVLSVITNFYPNLSIDTTGMLSKEEAVKIAFDNADIYKGFNTKEWQDEVSQYGTTRIDPITQTVVYNFNFMHAIAKKHGHYTIDAISKKVTYYGPNIGFHLTNCYKCNGSNTTMFSCEDTCKVNTCNSFVDGILVDVPTLYNGCQTIMADSCTINNKIVYSMTPDTLNFSNTDSINIFDASNLFGGQKAGKIKWCYTDSILSKKNVIATSTYYALQKSREYFRNRNIDYATRLKAIVHYPESPGDAYWTNALWSQDQLRFYIGDGNDTLMTAPVSLSSLSHEYGHAVLNNVFSIGISSTHPHRYQAGAIHEGVADIFSVLVRKHAFGSINWVIGDEILLVSNTGAFLPRDLAHPENTTPPQALYYNDTAANWDTTQSEIYNHAGIIAKWFYLITNGGTGYHYATDSLTVEPLTIDTAEMVLIGGLNKLDSLVADTTNLTVPSFAEFAVAMSASAQTISCTAYKQTVRALKAVGLGLNLPGGKTNAITDDEGLCFIDLRLRDCFNDQGFEPNTECDDLLGWNDIWNSPDIWVCPQNDSCYLAASAPPEPAVSNRIGFTIYNAHPNLISDPAELHLYYTMASSGELWDFNWVDWYFTSGDYTCYIGDEIATSPVEIPAINPNDYFTGWTTWSPPNFVNPNLPFYADPLECWLSPEIDPLDGELKYEICLLARLLSEADPIRHEIYDNIAHNVIYNNNIVTKNLFFLNPGLGVGGGTPPAIAGNPSVMLIANNNATTANLNIVYQQLANGLGLQGANDSIEISLILSPTLWSNWVSTGQQSQGITLLTQREVRIDNYQTAKLLNIPFVAYERQPIAIKTTILTNGNKTTYWQNNLNNIEFKFSVFHEAATNTAINPSSNCMFVLKNYHPVNNSPRDAIQLICTPNPVTTGWGKLQMYVPQPVTVSIALFNLSGIKVQQILSNQHYQSGLHQIPFNITNLPNGMYICQLNTQTKTVATKIIKLTN